MTSEGGHLCPGVHILDNDVVIVRHVDQVGRAVTRRSDVNALLTVVANLTCQNWTISKNDMTRMDTGKFEIYNKMELAMKSIYVCHICPLYLSWTSPCL